MAENLETDEKMDDELEDDVQLGYTGDLEEHHEEVDDDLEEVGEKVEADCHRPRPHYSGERSYIMYHGTTWEIAMKIKAGGFIPCKDGMLGRGIYLSRDFQKASRYPMNRTGRLAVLKVSVQVGKVKRINRQCHPLQYTWHQHGYDTAWIPPNCGLLPSGLEGNCVYDPRRIQVREIIPNKRC